MPTVINFARVLSHDRFLLNRQHWPCKPEPQIGAGKWSTTQTRSTPQAYASNHAADQAYGLPALWLRALQGFKRHSRA